MNSSTHVANRHRRRIPALTTLSLAMAATLYGLGATNPLHAQATTGSIFGSAPAAAGETVMAKSASGVTREVAVGADGRYAIKSLPVGTYTVTLRNGGQTIATHDNVAVSVATGIEVPFTAAANAANAQNLSAVRVVANALPSIDVSSVNSSTIITAADLRKLPVARSAESIALLAPGTVAGSSFFMGPGNKTLVAFSGSSVTENAYYVNGYNTGEPYKNLGGFQLPYGAIDQQETLTGGYSAKYGRSDGGVINQLGKRGTNEWHFGGQVAWQPRFLESNAVNNYYNSHPVIPASIGPVTYQLENPKPPRTLNQSRADNKQWQTIYSAYVGGPLIKDKLFLFLAAETTRTHSTNVEFAANQLVQYNRDRDNKFYGKLDWNITDNNVLELTALKNNSSIGAGTSYAFDTDTLKSGPFVTNNDITKDNAQFYLGHFTSYITDNATLSILYGKARFQDPTIYGNHSPLPFISRADRQDPALLPPGTGSNGIVNSQTNTSWTSAQAANGTHGLRVDFDYKLGDHDLSVGNDHFTNYNDLGKAFVDEKNQWEPRLGVSWDVFGDSSFKVYGNAGRYYLALPNNAAERAANRSTYLTANYSYTSIDPVTGIPQGLTQLGPTTSPDGEAGAPKDPLQVSARNLKPEYLDEFIVGFDKKLGDHWVYGAKAMWRQLKAAIDDECSPSQIDAKMQAMGVNP